MSEVPLHRQTRGRCESLFASHPCPRARLRECFVERDLHNKGTSLITLNPNPRQVAAKGKDVTLTANDQVFFTTAARLAM